MPQGILVTLDPDEITDGNLAGVRRHDFALKQALEGRQGQAPAKSLQDHITGCLTEKAAAKGLDRYWTPRVGILGPGDIGPLEVRGSPLDTACLIVRDCDRDDRAALLVTGCDGRYVLRGWLWVREGKRLTEFLTAKDTDRPPAYFVPQHALRDPALLLRSSTRDPALLA